MKKQQGFTMVELLVALVLTSIVSLAMLMFFKQSMLVSLDSRRTAEIDTKIQATLLTIKKLTQNAGFGIGQYEDIEEGSYASNPALLWRYLNSQGFADSVLCRGIGEEIDNDGIHRIVLLKKDDCATDDDLTSGTWTEDQQLVSFFTAVAAPAPVITYTLDPSAGCNPFGISADNGEGKKTLVIEANSDFDPDPDFDPDSSHKKILVQLCLINIIEDAAAAPAL